MILNFNNLIFRFSNIKSFFFNNKERLYNVYDLKRQHSVKLEPDLLENILNILDCIRRIFHFFFVFYLIQLILLFINFIGNRLQKIKK